MARPAKDKVDYFPHYCDHGKTMFVIEQRYGNNGYAFWFKLLELLGKNEGHFYDCNSIDNWEFLQAKTQFSEVECSEILNKLAVLGAIDKFLWEEKRIVWSDNFIKNIADAYKNRKRPVPKKPFLQVETTDKGIFTSKTIVSTPDNPQRRGEENRGEENRGEENRGEENRLDEETASVYQLFQNEIGFMSGTIVEMIDDDIKEYSAIWVKEAIKKSVAKGKRNLKYAEGILSSWKANGYNPDQEPWELEKRQKVTNSNNDSKPKFEPNSRLSMAENVKRRMASGS